MSDDLAGRLSGRLPSDLASAIMREIAAAMTNGIEADQAACVAVQVAADFAVLSYGDAYALGLRDIIKDRVKSPEYRQMRARMLAEARHE